MFKLIDDLLNKITMYRIVLYVLIGFFIAAFGLSIFKLIPYTPIDLMASLLIILAVSWITNEIFSFGFDAPTNTESVYITALILFFIISPAQSGIYSEFIPIALWASIWAIASKYILAIKRKHIFNPAAFGVALTAITINQTASWWIGTPNMLPFVLIGGLLITRKLKRFDVLLAFMVAALGSISVFAILNGNDILGNIIPTLKNSAFFFFAFLMLTEPLTAPTTRWWRLAFSVLVGVIFAPKFHIGGTYFTPEMALLTGNIFAYIVSPKEKLFLKLKRKVEIGTDTYDFIFDKDKNFYFRPGQYMEWTLPHRSPDNRGNRRYFTIASSPTEDEIHLGVKFYPEPSSYKNHLLAMPLGTEIIAAQKSGDFVLPRSGDTGLVFIAGGIGITPFRSMIQYLLDTKDKRNITLLYSNKKVSDISYKEVFDRAGTELGIKTIYAVTDPNQNITGSNMYNGSIDVNTIQKEVPDYANKIFYISGPHGMVNAFEKTLKSMGVPNRHIKIDFFPGFA